MNEWNLFDGVHRNKMFLFVSLVSLGLQIFLVEIGGDFVRTSPLTLAQWLITIGLGFLGVPIGILMRFIPVSEDPESFFTADSIIGSSVVAITDDIEMKDVHKAEEDDYELLLLETLKRKEEMKTEGKQELEEEEDIFNGEKPYH